MSDDDKEESGPGRINGAKVEQTPTEKLIAKMRGLDQSQPATVGQMVSIMVMLEEYRKSTLLVKKALVQLDDQDRTVARQVGELKVRMQMLESRSRMTGRN